jgi:hypothetical protein
MSPTPKNVQKRFPGNIGAGIRSDAAVNMEKNAIRIDIHFILTRFRI